MNQERQESRYLEECYFIHLVCVEGEIVALETKEMHVGQST